MMVARDDVDSRLNTRSFPITFRIALCLAKTLSTPEINILSSSHKFPQRQRFTMTRVHVQPHAAELASVETLLLFPWRLLLENLALRQQLAVLKLGARPKLNPLDKLFWVLVGRFWCEWKKSLLVVTPETVVGWHRTGFQLYWSLISKERKRAGRQPLSSEVRELLFRMVAENPTWGAPRIHGELAMLGV
jgi:hypothetical protein